MNPDEWNKEDVALTLATFNHSTYNQESLASVRFKEDDFYTSEPFAGAVLLQTCNRVEILIHGTKEELQGYLLNLGRNNAEILENKEVLLHLSRLASGMESMIVGEDQILGQLKAALLTAEKYHAADEIISTCISTAIQLGARIRQETSINRGAVSIGSAAVQLAEEVCGTLDNKNILVVGGGELGTLVTKSLAEKNLRAIYVTNRTYENAVKLAEEVQGRAMHMDQLETCISLSDVVISCTAAPHYIIKREMMEEIMEARFWPLDTEPRPLVLIDIAHPCDIEKSCSTLPGVRLFTIDDLKGISEQNLLARREECVHAEDIIEEFQPEFLRTLRRLSSRESLQELYSWAEEIRTREVEHAKHLLSFGKNPEEVIQNLTKSLTKKLMEDASANIRKKVEEQKYEEAESLVHAITGEK